jgi:hypothetical protein
LDAACASEKKVQAQNRNQSYDQHAGGENDFVHARSGILLSRFRPSRAETEEGD